MAFSPAASALLLKKHLTLIRTVTFPFRAFLSSKSDSPYVKNVRIQQGIKRRNEICYSDYKYGKYLILDCEKNTILLNRDKNNKQISWRGFEDVQNLGLNVVEESVFLTHDAGSSRFAVNVGNLPKELLFKLELSGIFVSLRSSLFILWDPETSLVSQSHSLLKWKYTNKYCSYCGGCLENQPYGVQKRCTGCKIIHYPAISPVGITLISNLSQSNVLLVRQPRHPPRMFTCVAGFIETGESIEENIKREVAEEVGLEIQDFQYIGSQHWSLQGSRLMVGCWVTVKDEEFELDSEELEEADWFSPQQLKSALCRTKSIKDKLLMDSKELWIPPPGAIAHTLVKTWLEKYHPYLSAS